MKEIMSQIFREIRKLDPFLWAEEKDAERWHQTCKESLIESYMIYKESEKRYNKIMAKVNRIKGDRYEPEEKEI
jgi:hypothetical protein